MNEIQETTAVEAVLDGLADDASAETVIHALAGFSGDAKVAALHRRAAAGGGGGGGSTPGALRVVGPFTITNDDMSEPVVDGYSIAEFMTFDGDELVLGFAWQGQVGFDDSSAGTGATISSLAPNGTIMGSQLEQGLVDLQSPATPSDEGTYGVADFSVPVSYTGSFSYSNVMPWFPAEGAKAALSVYNWTGDGTEGTIDIYVILTVPAAS